MRSTLNKEVLMPLGRRKKKKTTNIPGIKIICFHGVLVKGEKLFPLREAMREGTRGKEGETH